VAGCCEHSDELFGSGTTELEIQFMLNSFSCREEGISKFWLEKEMVMNILINDDESVDSFMIFVRSSRLSQSSRIA
jgi:hypothetical protein